jgi:DNA-binding XRE family transcriptional regulator
MIYRPPRFAPGEGAITLTDFERRFPPRESPAAQALAANVVRMRKHKGWTQAQLASESGIEQAAVSLIENARANPTLRMLEDISAALGSTPADLFFPPGTRPKKST